MRLIDADALHKAYMELRNFKQDPQSGDWISLRAVPLTTVIRMLNDAPTIEPKRGEWIDAEIRHEDGVLPIQVCSECKTFYPLEYTGGGHRFCPNCGADMRGEDDE